MAKKRKKKKVERSTILYSKRYPWDKWFKQAKRRDGLTLVRGTDFPCQVHSMAVQIRTAAYARDLTVSVQTVEDTLLVRVS